MKQKISDCVLNYSNLCTRILKNFAPEYYVVRKSFKLDYTESRNTHRGGIYAKGPGFNLCGQDFVRQYKAYQLGSDIGMFTEYKSFAKDPIIGSAYVENWKQYVGLTVGHEVAHAVQRYLEKVRKLERSDPHGDFFKKIYQILRLELNKELPDQMFAKEKYSLVLKRIKEVEYET